VKLVYDIFSLEARKYDFSLISLHKEFKELGFKELKVGKKDTLHPNALGHAVIAKKIYEHLEEGKNFNFFVTKL